MMTGDFDIEQSKVSEDSLPEWTGKMGATMIPRYAFLLETDHQEIKGKDERMKEIKEKIKSKTGGTIPETVLETLTQSVYANMFAKNNGNLKLREYSVMAIIEDTVGKSLQVIVNTAHTRASGSDLHYHTPRVMHTENDMEQNSGALWATVRTSAAAMAYNPDWKGTRILPAIELEATSLEEMDTAFSKTAHYEIWKSILPREATASPLQIEAVTPEITQQNRADLVKRFGEKAIKLAEKRIKEAQKNKAKGV